MLDEITIVLLLYEEKWETLYKCLKSIRNFKIIIVDNSNNASRKKEIEKQFKIHKYFLNKKNVGFGAGNNIGIKNCDSKYVLILSSDCIIPEQTIFELKRSLEKYNNCFLTTPTFVDENGKVSQNASQFPEINPVKIPLDLDGDICCQSVLGAAMFCRTNDLKKIGMFDEKFFIFYEDDDLCRRIGLEKKSKIQIKSVKAVHQHGQGKSVKNSLKRTFLINHNMAYSELYYFFKINQHQEKYKKLKKKIPNYMFKTLICFFTLRINRSVFFISKILAFYKFKRFIKKKDHN